MDCHGQGEGERGVGAISTAWDGRCGCNRCCHRSTEVVRDRAQGVTRRCASNPSRIGAIAGSKDKEAVTGMPQCVTPHHTARLPSPASHAWSKSSQQAHAGCTEVFLMVCSNFIPRGTVQVYNVIFCLIVLKPLKEVSCIYWIQEPK